MNGIPDDAKGALYFSAGEGAYGSLESGRQVGNAEASVMKGASPLDLDLVTICIVVLADGRKVIGHHVADGHDGFDAETSRLSALNFALSNI